MSISTRDSESISMGATLSAVVIGPDEERQRTIAKAFSGAQSRVAREFASYPAYDDLAQIFEGNHDIVLVDLDVDPEKALEIVENLCGADGSLTVIMYSARTNSDLLVRCMRAGAREFLTEPVSPNAVAEALVRASVRRDEVRRVRKPAGKLFVFTGSKGGSGVTTLASNFALSLAKESGTGKSEKYKVALIDLDFHLGDAGLTLGVTSKYSVADALESVNRLDADFLSVMMAKHPSGLSVLCARDRVSSVQPSRAGVERVLNIARENYNYVVVDAGALSSDVAEYVFEAASSVYLVTQVAVPELRNANRLLAEYFTGADASRVEIVLNRYVGR